MSSAMLASGVVMIRLVKLVPGAVNPPVVVPAPKITSWAAVVVTDPLFGVVPVPIAEWLTSIGYVGSRPLYSVARMSMNGAAVLKVTVTVFAPAAAALIFLA